MRYEEYREKIEHGTLDFPIAYYGLDSHHPRYQMMLHWHPEFELVRVRRGRFHMDLDGRRMTVEAGDAVLISDGVCHSGQPEGDGCEYECLVFDLQRFVAQNRIGSGEVLDILRHEKTVCSFLPREAAGLYEQLEQLFAAMRQRQPGYELFVQGSLYLLLGIIVRDRLYSTDEESVRRSRSQQASLKNAILYMEENYAGHITLDDLARAAGMSRKYFCSFFRNMTQKSPVDYLNSYRVEKACEALLRTDRTVAQIAGDCGFNDVSYFTKIFRRYAAQTPLGYRKSRSKNTD